MGASGERYIMDITDTADQAAFGGTAALIVDGKPVATSRGFDVIDPATGTAFAQAPLASPADLDRAVAAARRAFPGWAATPVEERAAAMERIADAIEAERDALGAILSREQGKPLQKSAVGEIMGAAAWARATAKLRPPVEVVKDLPNELVEVHRRPLGVVGSITPWNYPVLIAIWHVIPALVAGNTVVLKPSPYTPLSTLRLIEIANAHLPAGVLNSVTGDAELGQAMTGHPGIDKIVFTGSTPTGRRIMASGATNLRLRHHRAPRGSRHPRFSRPPRRTCAMDNVGLHRRARAWRGGIAERL